MTQQEINQLYEHNIHQIEQMDVAAGSMVKNLILKAERNDVGYVKLSSANGHTAHYEIIEGTVENWSIVSSSLGLTMLHGVIQVPGQ